MGKSKSLFFFFSWSVMDRIMMLSIFQSFSIPSVWWRVTWRGRSQSWKDEGEVTDGWNGALITLSVPELRNLVSLISAAADECPSALVSSLAALLPISSNVPVLELSCAFFLDYFLEWLIILEVISQRSLYYSNRIPFNMCINHVRYLTRGGTPPLAITVVPTKQRGHCH